MIQKDQLAADKGRRLEFDILRLLAILLVVYNHTGTNGFSLFTQNCSAVNYVLSLGMAIVSKIAVPLFFMISGGLLLAKEEPISVLLKKRVLRMVLVLLIFSLLNYGMRIHWGTVTEPGIYDFCRKLWSEGLTDPYWYLYTYIGLLLLTPFLRPMVQNMPDRAFMYLCLLNLLFVGVLPVIGFICDFGYIVEDFWIPLVTKNGIYYLLGYYLMHRLSYNRLTGRWLLRLWLAAIAAVFVTACLMTWDREELWCYFEKFTLWPALAVYLTVVAWVKRHPITPLSGRILKELGSCVFGTYLLEGILRYEYTPLFQALRPRLHQLPACIVFTLAVIATGMAITTVLRRIPGIRRLL